MRTSRLLATGLAIAVIGCSTGDDGEGSCDENGRCDLGDFPQGRGQYERFRNFRGAIKNPSDPSDPGIPF